MLQSAYWFKLVQQIVTEHPHKKLQPQGLTLVVIPQYVVTQQVAASSCFGTFLELGVR